MLHTAEGSFEFCAFCGEITIGDEQHDCTPFRPYDPYIFHMVRMGDAMKTICKQLARLIEIVEHEK